MNRAAMIFLVLLRLAIGWHFFMEGVQKVQSVYLGETTTSKPFSSAAYFREAPGPGGSLARATMGEPDPDAEAVALLTVEAADGDGPTLPPHKSMPPELRRQWERLVADYAGAYKLSEAQQKEAGVMLDQAGDNVVLWLTSRTADATSPEVTRKYASGDVKRRIAPAELIAEYKARLAELKQVNERKLWAFGKDVEKAELKQKKADVAARRTTLMAELDKHVFALMRSLNLMVAEPVLDPLGKLDVHFVKARSLLADANDAAFAHRKRWWDWAPDSDGEQQIFEERHDALVGLVRALRETDEAAKELYPLSPDVMGSEKVSPINPKALGDSLEARGKSLAESAAKLSEAARGDKESEELAKAAAEAAGALGKKSGELPRTPALSLAPKPSKMLERVGFESSQQAIDWLTRWGLTAVGLCLMCGFFTRTNAWLAAGFLLVTYLAVPPWPWLPAVGPSEGNYLFVNKNLIEMLALCVLGATASGRAFGFDAITSWLWKQMRGKKDEGQKAADSRSQAPPGNAL